MIGIYIITHKDSFKRYVGQSIDITDRLSGHWRQLKSGKHDNSYLQRAYNKYGRDAFTVSTIECAEDLLTKIEQSMLDQWSNLYNICKIANVPPSQKGKKRKPRTAEHTTNLSNALKGKRGPQCRPRTAEHKAKIAAALTGRPTVRKDYKHSEETKAKMCLAQQRRRSLQ